MKSNNFADSLTKFLSKHLPSERGASSYTIASYRDTFKLFLIFLRDEYKIPAHKLELKALNKEKIEDFLNWIEKERGCCVSTRNVRLAAIHSFFKYIQYENPDYLSSWKDIMAIPVKKCEKQTPSYMPLDGIQLLLQMPDQNTKNGRKDLALLSLMFDTGARVSELINLIPEMVRLDKPSTVKLIGKGQKARIIPLIPQQIEILKQYMEENDLLLPKSNKYPLFTNYQGRELTRQGVGYILKKYLDKARKSGLFGCQSIPDDFSCHSMRHSKAMAMLSGDADLIYIRDILGHSSVKTTEVYARIDSKKKREAIEAAYTKTSPNVEPIWHSDDALMDWLNDLV